VPADEMGTLREQLGRPGAFVVAAELVTSRGLLSAESGRALQARARELAANPRIDAATTGPISGIACRISTRASRMACIVRM